MGVSLRPLLGEVARHTVAELPDTVDHGHVLCSLVHGSPALAAVPMIGS